MCKRMIKIGGKIASYQFEYNVKLRLLLKSKEAWSVATVVMDNQTIVIGTEETSILLTQDIISYVA